jgi:glutathione S-transferase
MIVVHHLNNSRSQRVLWLLEELGVPYEVKRYDRDPRTMLAPIALRAVHPLGKSPVISDGDLVVAESGAIIEYLLDTYGDGRLQPPAGPERLSYRYWLHYAEGSAMPPMLISLVASRIAGPQTPWFVRPVARLISTRLRKQFIAPQLRLHLDFMEQSLVDNGWFAGKGFTAADIQMSFPVEVAAAREGLGKSRPHLLDWLAKIHARPAYQRALAVGGRYELSRGSERP